MTAGLVIGVLVLAFYVDRLEQRVKALEAILRNHGVYADGGLS